MRRRTKRTQHQLDLFEDAKPKQSATPIEQKIHAQLAKAIESGQLEPFEYYVVIEDQKITVRLTRCRWPILEACDSFGYTCYPTGNLTDWQLGAPGVLKEISGDRFYVEALVDTPYFYELGARYCEAYRFAYRFLMEAKIDFKYESIRKVLKREEGREDLLVYLDALLLGRDVPAPADLQRY